MGESLMGASRAKVGRKGGERSQVMRMTQGESEVPACEHIVGKGGERDTAQCISTASAKASASRETVGLPRDNGACAHLVAVTGCSHVDPTKSSPRNVATISACRPSASRMWGTRAVMASSRASGAAPPPSAAAKQGMCTCRCVCVRVCVRWHVCVRAGMCGRSYGKCLRARMQM